jgi:uncharacterized membrane protein
MMLGTLQIINPAASASAVTFTAINRQIIVPKCVQCHSATNASAGLNFSTYEGVVTDGVVVPGHPEQSSIFLQVQSGAMPMGSTPKLTSAELQLLSDWITAGGKND